MANKALTKEQYLEAVALFKMAKQYHAKAERFEAALLHTLAYGTEDGHGGYISDAIYCDLLSLDDALQREGYDLPTGAAYL